MHTIAQSFHTPKQPFTLALNPSISALTILTVLILLSACTLEPRNGTTFSGSNVGRSVFFDGYTPTAGDTMAVQVLDPPTQDPKDPSSTWTTIATTIAVTGPIYVNSDQPLYYWSLSATIVPDATFAYRWPAGGLTKVRVRAGADNNAATFDDTDCVSEHLTDPWETIYAECKSHDNGLLTLVDTDPRPSPAFPYLSLKETAVAETKQYYATIGAGPGQARTTLSGWREANGYNGEEVCEIIILPNGKPERICFELPPNETEAIYYNAADLGIGREMHCRAKYGGGVACYVTNYGDAADGLADQQDALADAVAGHAPFATVAMEYVPGSAANRVRFYVYDRAGTLLTQAALDSQGPKPVPGICLACHGGSYDPASKSVTGASFLPFDVFSFKYADISGYHLADQQEAFRKLNAHVRNTQPTTGIQAFIDGMYAPDSVTTPDALAHDTYVPPGWTYLETVYNKVIKPYCRMCHLAIPTADWTDVSQLVTRQSTIEDYVCNSWEMPHAEVTHTAFWASSARAHLIGMLNLQTTCDAGTGLQDINTPVGDVKVAISPTPQRWLHLPALRRGW